MLPCRLDPDLHYFGGHENMNYRTPSEAAKVDSPGKEWARWSGKAVGLQRQRQTGGQSLNSVLTQDSASVGSQKVPLPEMPEPDNSTVKPKGQWSAGHRSPRRPLQSSGVQGRPPQWAACLRKPKSEPDTKTPFPILERNPTAPANGKPGLRHSALLLWASGTISHGRSGWREGVNVSGPLGHQIPALLQGVGGQI